MASCPIANVRAVVAPQPQAQGRLLSGRLFALFVGGAVVARVFLRVLVMGQLLVVVTPGSRRTCNWPHPRRNLIIPRNMLLNKEL